jgi:hypothetical protein
MDALGSGWSASVRAVSPASKHSGVIGAGRRLTVAGASLAVAAGLAVGGCRSSYSKYEGLLLEVRSCWQRECGRWLGQSVAQRGHGRRFAQSGGGGLNAARR